jgi:hypothetical protein
MVVRPVVASAALQLGSWLKVCRDCMRYGHPLRMTTHSQVRYDYGKKRVVSEPLELTQEFRCGWAQQGRCSQPSACCAEAPSYIDFGLCCA